MNSLNVILWLQINKIGINFIITFIIVNLMRLYLFVFCEIKYINSPIVIIYPMMRVNNGLYFVKLK